MYTEHDVNKLVSMRRLYLECKESGNSFLLGLIRAGMKKDQVATVYDVVKNDQLWAKVEDLGPKAIAKILNK